VANSFADLRAASVKMMITLFGKSFRDATTPTQRCTFSPSPLRAFAPLLAAPPAAP